MFYDIWFLLSITGTTSSVTPISCAYCVRNTTALDSYGRGVWVHHHLVCWYKCPIVYNGILQLPCYCRCWKWACFANVIFAQGIYLYRFIIVNLILILDPLKSRQVVGKTMDTISLPNTNSKCERCEKRLSFKNWTV